jgi:hypothetical protein
VAAERCGCADESVVDESPRRGKSLAVATGAVTSSARLNLFRRSGGLVRLDD